MEYTIRSLTNSDVEVALALFQWMQEPSAANNVPVVDAANATKLLSNPGFHALAALHEGVVVGGLIAYELPMYTGQFAEMFLYDIGVEDSFQRKGIATGMIEELKRICQRKHINTIFVGTSVDNEAARKLYEATGGELEIIPWYTYALR